MSLAEAGRVGGDHDLGSFGRSDFVSIGTTRRERPSLRLSGDLDLGSALPR